MKLKSAVICVVALFALPAWSQILTHPTELGLPESSYERPDPTGFEHALDNGLVAYIAESSQVPLVTLSAFVRAGLVSDDAEGAAEVLRDALLRSGPASLEAGEFAQQLNQMAARLTVVMHDEWTEISLNLPAEDADAGFALFAGLLRDPAVSRDNIDRAAGQAAPGALDLGGESGAALYAGSMDVAVGHFNAALYDGHAYGYQPTEKDFRRLKPRDVREFHVKRFVPGNTTLAIAGAVDPKHVRAQIDSYFGDWPASNVAEPTMLPGIRKQPFSLSHYPSNKLQSWLVMGHELPPVPLEDQAAFDVMTYILGAYHLNTRLMRETRYKYGYTNDTSAFVDDHWDGPGSYTIRSYSRPEVIENIYRNVVIELHKIRDEEVSDEELFVAIGALTDGLYQVRYHDGYALTRSFALAKLRYGDHQKSASYVDRVRDVSKADVLDAARRYLQPDSMHVVVLGEAAFEL